MTLDDPPQVHCCKWSWCRLNFSDCDALVHHVVFEHVRRASPVRRKDIALLKRTEEGLGESIKLSDIMHNPSSSLSQSNLEQSLEKGIFLLLNAMVFFNVCIQERPSSSQQPSSPPSLPVSSSLPLSQHDADQPLRTSERAANADVHPILASLEIPPSSFSSLVRRSQKRKLPFEEPGNSPYDPKPFRESLSQESTTSVSNGSQSSVEEHLTQSSPSVSYVNTGVTNPDSNDEDENKRTLSVSSSSLIESTERDHYRTELNWEASGENSSQIIKSNEPRHQKRSGSQSDALSQPPSQFRHSPFIYRTGLRISNSKYRPIQTDSYTNLPLPLNTPIPLSSPTGFAISTPQRQNWYQRPPWMKVSNSNRIGSGEDTLKPSRKQELSINENADQSQVDAFPQTQSEPQIGIASNPLTSPIIKKPVFRSGVLQVSPGSTCAQSRSQSPVKSRSLSKVTADEDVAPPENAYIWNDSQSQLNSQLSMSGEFASYPPLQSQAPYQSQSLLQLD